MKSSKLSKFASKKIDAIMLNPVVGGAATGTTSSKGSTTMSAGADTDPRGNDTDQGSSLTPVIEPGN